MRCSRSNEISSYVSTPFFGCLTECIFHVYYKYADRKAHDESFISKGHFRQYREFIRMGSSLHTEYQKEKKSIIGKNNVGSFHRSMIIQCLDIYQWF